ncbi:Methionine synthase, vitamin-B12 independent [Penicillium griseofulvum]|uniref:Methionine synthase, vitamin-B12 independent n=1 Tax=Penicillium patulum TaxID=5078 RepID=A0A135LBH5_PENPA|nr:Methionine synthase, vitamin-B12 independent [Penicillium griseofulvum]KXG46321.1 Methionine synthase, vitamin-B12 independent [Penicillium griseofulvum]
MAKNLHTAPPFRAEHLGSLLRPANLLDVRAKISTGISAEAAGLPSIEQEAVREVVKMQQDLGFKAITSGEYNRTRFWGLMWDEFEGTIRLQNAESSMFRLYHPDVVSLIEKDRKVMPGDSVIAASKLSHSPASQSNLHELRLVQASLPQSEWSNIKLTMITPAWFHMRYKQGRAYTPDAYSNDAEYFADVAKVYRAELESLYAAGLRNVQFDDPGMAYFCSKSFREGWDADPDNEGSVDDLLDAYIRLYNDILVDLPMHTGIHLCRGNFIGGRHFSEGSYDVIAKKLFEDLEVDTFYLEYDTERAGGFEPLRFLPKGKNVVVGVISSKVRELEDKEAVKERIYLAADFVAQGSRETREEALKRVCISPQCGFSTHESGYPLLVEHQKKKLGLVREIADEIWGEP